MQSLLCNSTQILLLRIQKATLLVHLFTSEGFVPGQGTLESSTRVDK